MRRIAATENVLLLFRVFEVLAIWSSVFGSKGRCDPSLRTDEVINVLCFRLQGRQNLYGGAANTN